MFLLFEDSLVHQESNGESESRTDLEGGIDLRASVSAHVQKIVKQPLVYEIDMLYN